MVEGGVFFFLICGGSKVRVGFFFFFCFDVRPLRTHDESDLRPKERCV